MLIGLRVPIDHLAAPLEHDLGRFVRVHERHPGHHPRIRRRQHWLGGYRPQLDHTPPASQLRRCVRAGTAGVVGDAELPLGAEYQHEDVGDLAANR